MPPSGWRHTQIWLYGHWLPGDPRGFRSRDHRIHSGGDYKHRPPQGEHANLHAHATGQLKAHPVTLTPAQRRIAGALIVQWFTMKHIPLAAVSVSGAHAHILAQLPRMEEDVTVGKVKRYVSTQASRQDASIPSRLFAGKGEPKAVATHDHFVAAYDYITVKHAREGAWIWGADVDQLATWWSYNDPGQGRGRP